MKLIRKLRLMFHPFHSWETTHVNPYQIPTREKCFCGLTRKKEMNPETITIAGMEWPKMEWRWRYSDGRVSVYNHMLDHNPKEDPTTPPPISPHQE